MRAVDLRSLTANASPYPAHRPGLGGFTQRATGHQRRMMMSESDQQVVARVVVAISERTPAQGSALAAALAARWSPPDRLDPLALEWLRRWSPQPAHVPPPACSCADGHCLICN
jgi:hypothetical protein